MANRVPERFNIADRRAGLRWIPARIVDSLPDPNSGPGNGLPSNIRGPGAGDILDGGVAIVALLGMLVLGLPPLLAIPLSILTYIAVALLRSVPEHPQERINGLVQEQPPIVEIADEVGPRELLKEEFIGVDAVGARFGLTRREREVLPLLAHRFTDREIAEQLSISHRTAMNHTANILGKLGLESRREVAALIARHASLSASVPPHEPE